MSVGSIDDHPIVKWGAVLMAIATCVATAVGCFMYLEDLRRETSNLHSELIEGFDEKKELDQTWIDLDRKDHDAMIHLGKDIRSDIKVLGERFKSDPGLLYQLGLRDGKALCEAAGGK